MITEQDFHQALLEQGRAQEFSELTKRQQRAAMRMAGVGMKPSFRERITAAKDPAEASAVLMEAAAAGVPVGTLRKLRHAVEARLGALRVGALRAAVQG